MKHSDNEARRQALLARLKNNNQTIEKLDTVEKDARAAAKEHHVRASEADRKIAQCDKIIAKETREIIQLGKKIEKGLDAAHSHAAAYVAQQGITAGGSRGRN